MEQIAISKIDFPFCQGGNYPKSVIGWGLVLGVKQSHTHIKKIKKKFQKKILNFFTLYPPLLLFYL
jgi:hypothetical protein